MRAFVIAIVLCACADLPAAEYLEPCDDSVGCASVEDFCAEDLGICTHVCRVPGLPTRTESHQCVAAEDCPESCCLLTAVWEAGFDGTLSGSGVCVPLATDR